MRTLRRTTARWLAPTVLASALVCLTYPQEAHAYVDPGTGSMLLQAAIAIVVGGTFALKMYWHRLKARFTKKPADGPDPSRDDEE